MAEERAYYNIFEIIGVIIDFVNGSQEYYQYTHNGIPADTFILVRYFYFLFMPISFQYLGVFQSYFVLENFFLIFIFFIMIKNIRFNQEGINKLTRIFYLSIFLCFLVMPIIFSNYGIALRYKWLMIPFLLLAILDYRKKTK